MTLVLKCIFKLNEQQQKRIFILICSQIMIQIVLKNQKKILQKCILMRKLSKIKDNKIIATTSNEKNLLQINHKYIFTENHFVKMISFSLNDD